MVKILSLVNENVKDEIFSMRGCDKEKRQVMGWIPSLVTCEYFIFHMFNCVFKLKVLVTINNNI